MAIKKVYKCYMPSMNYITAKGRTCTFVEGRFLTDHPDEISELDAMVQNKSNPHIYVDENEKEVDTTLQEKIKNAQREATLAVLEEEAKRKAAESGNGAGGSQTNQATSQEPQANQGAGTTMSPASLLNVTTSAGLSALSSLSNSK